MSQILYLFTAGFVGRAILAWSDLRARLTTRK